MRTRTSTPKWLSPIVVALLGLSSASVAHAAGGGRTYTLNADFDEGAYSNVAHPVPDQIQLDETTTPFNFIWIAVSSKGTTVKINTETGAILGEYRTSPQGQPADPSRTTVDLNGNVWNTNRAGHSVVHIGLLENGQCQDRNGDGVINTSTGLGDVRPWSNLGGIDTNGGVDTAEDECILHYVLVQSWGTRHVSVTPDNNVWVSGLGDRSFDLLDGNTGAILRHEQGVGYGGYGGLIDGNGVIWSARPMLRWPTADPLFGGATWKGYHHESYGLCIDSLGNVWNTSYGQNAIRKFDPDGNLVGTYSQGNTYAQGCVVDANDHVWVAHSLGGTTVGHLKADGSYVGTVAVGSGPTGVAVDAAGKVWATNYSGFNASRIDPALGPLGPDGVTHVGAVDFTTPNLGGYLYNYSDMTGSTLQGAPKSGTWTVTYDGGEPAVEWGTVTWTADVLGDGAINVTAASSEDGVGFGPEEPVSAGVDLTVADGRFLRLSTIFSRATTGESPILYDLTVKPANEPPFAVAGGPYWTLEGSAVGLDGTASSDPDGDPLDFAWDLDNDGIFETAGATPDFLGLDGPSTWPIALRVCDPDGECAFAATWVDVGNVAPLVDAGPDQVVYRNDPVLVAGAFVDPAGALDNPYAFAWDLDGNGMPDAWGSVLYGAPASAATSFALEGSYLLTVAIADKDGGFGIDMLNVDVLNRPPECDKAAPTVAMLWPPNHHFVPVDIVGVSDPEDDPVSITITSISQDEPVESLGDGSFEPDGMGVGTPTAELRAERAGTKKEPGNGRVYHIGFTADDGHGGSCAGTLWVGVPHDMAHAPIDDGALYDSTQPGP